MPLAGAAGSGADPGPPRNAFAPERGFSLLGPQAAGAISNSTQDMVVYTPTQDRRAQRCVSLPCSPLFLCPVLCTDQKNARVWLAPGSETVVTHPSSARMTHGALHAASCLCTEHRCCIWKAQAVAAQHLRDAPRQAFTANDIYCKTNQN